MREKNKVLKNSSQLIIDEGVSQQKYDELKRFIKEVMLSLSQEAKNKLIVELNKRIQRKNSISASGNTQELMLYTKEVIESAKELRKELEAELTELQKQFQEKEAEITYLEAQVQGLTDQGEKQKEKIINSLLQIFPEKELLQELIKIHLEFAKAKKQKQPVVKLKKQKEKIYDELEKKLNDEEMMEKIEIILTDCEELIAQELELETKLNSKDSLIEEQKKQILQMTSDSEERGEITESKSKLAKQEQTQ